MMKQNSFLFKLYTSILTRKRKLKADGYKEQWEVCKNILSINKSAWKVSVVAIASGRQRREAILDVSSQCRGASGPDVLHQRQSFKFRVSWDHPAPSLSWCRELLHRGVLKHLPTWPHPLSQRCKRQSAREQPWWKGEQLPSQTFVSRNLEQRVVVVLEGNNSNPTAHVFLGFLS